MKQILLAAALLLTALTAAPNAGAAVTPDDERLLRAIADQSDAYWNARDSAALGAMFADDAQLRMASREPVVSRTAITGYFRDSFARVEPAMRHVTRITRLQELAPGVVIADGEVSLERVTADGKRETVRRFLNHTVLVKTDGAWRFKALRVHPQPAI